MTGELTPSPSRRTLLRGGVLAGLGVTVAGLAVPVLAGTGTAQAASTPQGIQDQWWWCGRCQGLFFNDPAQIGGYCPAGGPHNGTGSINYTLNYGLASYASKSASWQAGWNWCMNCSGMFFGQNPSKGWCPAFYDTPHNGSRSWDYDVNYNTPASDGFQPGWAWCGKCQGLFYTLNGTSGLCPAGGAHNGSGSWPYDLYTA